MDVKFFLSILISLFLSLSGYTQEISVSKDAALLDFGIGNQILTNIPFYASVKKLQGTSVSAYQWSTDDGKTWSKSSQSSTFSAFFSTDGLFKIRCKALLANGKNIVSDAIPFQVYLNASLRAFSVDSSLKTCGGGQIKLVAKLFDENSKTIIPYDLPDDGKNYNWNTTGNITPTLSNYYKDSTTAIYGDVKGTSSIFVSYYNSSLLGIQLSQFPKTSIEIVGRPSLSQSIQLEDNCDKDATFQLSVLDDTLNDSFSLRWDFGDGNSVISNSISSIKHRYNSAKKYIIGLTIKNISTGCASSLITDSFFIGKPSLDLSSNRNIDAGICSKDSAIRFSVDDHNYGSKWQWYIDDNKINAEGYEDTLNYNQLVVGSHHIVVKNTEGCLSESNGLDFTILSVPPKPSFSYKQTENCNEVQITNTTSDKDNYNFSFLNDSEILYDGSDNAFKYTFDHTGDYSVLIIAQNKDNSCQSKNSQNVVVTGPKIVLTSESGGVGCVNWPVSLKIDLEDTVQDNLPTSYSINWGDGTSITNISYSESLNQLAKHTFSSSNQYQINVVANFTSNCNISAATYAFNIGEACIEKSKAFGLEVQKRDCAQKKKITIDYTDDSDPAQKIYSIDSNGVEHDFIKDSQNENRYSYIFPNTGIDTIHVLKESGLEGAIWVYLIDFKPKIDKDSDVFVKLCNYQNTGLSIDDSDGDEIKSNLVKDYSWSIDNSKVTSGNELKKLTGRYKPTGYVYNINYKIEDINSCIDSAQTTLFPQGPNVDFTLIKPTKSSIQILKNNDISYFQSCDSLFQGTIAGENLNKKLQIVEWNWTVADDKNQTNTTDLNSETIELNFSNNSTYDIVALQLQAKGSEKVNGQYCVSAPVKRTVAILSHPISKYTILNNDRSFCIQKGKTFHFDASESSSFGKSNYVWNWEDGSLDTLQNVDSATHIFPQLLVNQYTKVYSPSLTVIDQNGCKDLYQVAIDADSMTNDHLVRIVKPKAQFDLISDPQNCLPKIVTLKNVSEQAISYDWNFGDGSNRPAQLTDNVQHQYYSLDTNANGKITQYTVKLKSKDMDGCVDEMENIVNVNGIYAKLRTNNTSDFCEGKSIVQLSVEKYYSAIVPNWSYQWNLNDNSVSSDNDSTINYIYTKAGTYSPFAIVSGNINNEKCYVNAYLADSNIIVYNVPNPTITAYQKGRICLGDSAQFHLDKNEILLDPSNKDYHYSYTWNPDFIETKQNDYFFSLQSSGIIRLTASNSHCVFDTSMTIKVDSLPSGQITGEIGFCSPTENTKDFNLQLSNADEVFNWNISKGEENWIFEIIKNKTYQLTIPEGYNTYMTPFTYWVSKKDGACNAQQMTYKFYTSSAPKVKNISLLLNNSNYINVSSPITAGQKVKILPSIQAASPYETLYYNWSPNSFFDKSDIAQPSFISNQNQKIEFKINNEFGCTTTDTFSITVNDIPSSDIYQRNIPNAFSPNGDGKNDYFYISGFGIKMVKSLAIFNRVGQQIFLSTNTIPNDQLKGWNGYLLNGQQAPIATYVYVAQILTNEGKLISLKGIITLIR